MRRPFVVVIQDDFIRANVKLFSKGHAWVFDSIFKMNQYYLPLYTTIVLNEDGKIIKE